MDVARIGCHVGAGLDLLGDQEGFVPKCVHKVGAGNKPCTNFSSTCIVEWARKEDARAH